MFSLLSTVNKHLNVFQPARAPMITDLHSILCARHASKKAGSSSRNSKGKPRPKHRRVHYQDASYVTETTMLVRQTKLRFHPGLNVGIGKNLTLFAMVAGKVLVTCEKFDPDMSHSFVQRLYEDRDPSIIYKKYFHVIPEEQHCRFKKINEV